MNFHAAQMPAMPPIKLKIIEENEKTLPPHRAGTKLPMVDPIAIPKNTIDFDIYISIPVFLKAKNTSFFFSIPDIERVRLCDTVYYA